MKKLILSIIFASIALISANAAPCKAEHDWYIQGTGSLGWHTNSKIKIADYRTENEKHKKGFGGAVAIGYIMDSWRFELEGSYRQNKATSFTHPDMVIKSNTSLMFNVLHDIPLTDLVSVYVGAGVGFSSVDGKTSKIEHSKSKSKKYKHSIYSPTTKSNSSAVAVQEIDNEPATTTKFKKKSHLDIVGAGQLMAGLTYKISDNVDLIGGYRLFATTKPSFKFNGTKAKQKNIPITHCVETGLRFKF